jgi:hypothetical protein
MPGRRAPSRRAIGTSGGGTPVLGSLVLSTSAIAGVGIAGDPAFDLEDTLAIYNGGPGTWSGAPSVGVTYATTPDWLTLTPVSVGGFITYTFTVDTTLLAAGTEVATVTVTDARCSNSPQVMTVTITVTAAAVALIGLSQSTFTPSVAAGATGTALTCTISNVGNGTLATPTVGTITGTGASYVGTPAITGSGPWTLTITPNATAASAGSYQAVIPVVSAAAGNTPQNVTVNLTVTAAAAAIISIPSSGQEGKYTVGSATNPTPHVFIVQNAGAAAFAGLQAAIGYSGTSSGWLSASFVGQELTLTFDCQPNVTVQGVSYATVTLSDANAISDAIYVVDLYTSAAAIVPNITATPASISRVVNTGITPAQGTVTVGNSTGSLAELGTVTATDITARTWLTVGYSSGVVTATFSGVSALAAGSYSATIRIAGSLAGNGYADVPVTIIVQVAPAVPLLRFALPSGVTQNATTGYCEGVPTGVVTTAPNGWNATPTHTPANTAQFLSALAASASSATADGNGNIIIEMNPAVTYSGTQMTIPAPTSRTGWLIIRTANYGSLPARGTRISAADEANLFTLQAPGQNEMLLMGDNVAKVYILGMKTTDVLPGDINYNHVVVKPATNVLNQSTVPQDIYFDHCWFKGNPRIGGGSIRGLYWIANRSGVLDCKFTDFKKGNFGASTSPQESQAILIPHSGGFYYVYNSQLESAGECFFVGGTALPGQDPAWNPHDIYLKQCVLNARTTWCKTHADYLGQDYAFKNLTELKRGIRVLYDGCVLHDGFADDQSGLCIVIKSTNQTGNNLNSYCDDVQFHLCHGFNMQRTFGVIGVASNVAQAKRNERVHFLENLFERINMPGLSPSNSGHLHETANNCLDVWWERNTLVTNGGNNLTGACLVAAMTNINIIDNIMPQGNNGMIGTGTSQGIPSMNQYWTNYNVTRNVLYAGSASTNYPAGNFFPGTEASVGFVNLGGTAPADYTLTPASPYYTASATGGPLGANMTRVGTRTAGVLTGVPTG